MKGLLIKDMMLNFRSFKTIFIYLFISVFMSFSMDGSFIIAYTAMLLGMMGLGTIAYDEMDNGYPFLLSLPGSRKTYVQEKCLYCSIMEVIGAIFGLLIYVISSIIKGVDIDLTNGLPMVIGIILVTMLVIFFMIMIELKYGSEKSRVVLMIIYGVLFVLMMAISRVKPLSIFIFKIVNSLSETLLISSIFIIVIALMILFYFLSVRVMENKEF
ncbi:MAG: ABC-2 transporter permease [Erysipelotrichaceae bacterium]|nr:ABC-2 transporter permease [Erysipelotrichaceae bacterium]